LLYDQAIQPGASKAAKWLGFFQGFEMVDSWSHTLVVT
jgi:hypothetical protein